MKICFFTENHYKGGLDTFIINLFNTWPEAKDELTLVCNESHQGLETIIKATHRPIRIKRYFRVFTSTFLKGHSNLKWSQFFLVRALFVLTFRIIQYPILFPWYVVTLMLFFWRSNFDRLMVINGGYPASLLGRSAVIAWWLAGKRPLAVMNFHNSTTTPPWYYSLFENGIDSLVIRSTSRIVSVSKNCLDSLYNRNAFVGCRKLSYIYNGIEDPKILWKDTSSTINNKQPIKPYCLMLATYETRKGHTYLLKAFQIVVKDFPDVQLQIYGHGRPQEKERVANEVKKLKLENNVKLGDFTFDTAALLANAKVLVVPSQAYESFGLTIIEAMAFGIPVVTTDVGGIPEVIGDSNAGYVCSKDNFLEFATAIKNILQSQHLASELGKNGRLTYQNRFMSEIMSKNYKYLLQ